MGKPIKKETENYRINDDIRMPNHVNVRVLGEGDSKVMTMKEARELADSMELDIIEINSRIDVPLMKIEDYGKFMYENKKKKKAQKQKVGQLKEIQLSVSIAEHDLMTKANQARRFLKDGDKVKVVLSMRGRELARREENKKSIFEFIVALEDDAIIESAPRDEGNRTISILSPKRKK